MDSIILFIVVIGIILYILFGSKKKVSEDDNYIPIDDKIKAGELELIISNYGKALASGTNGIVRPISLLENSKSEIKDAILKYIRIMLKYNQLTKEHYNNLAFMYSGINSFVDDELAEQINSDFNKRIPPNDMKAKYGDIISFILRPLPDNFPVYNEPVL